ncbi:MAG: patatin-like phospholipase family protein [Candidatus Omnitrophica bacterium]|nr:patatin-like phospholipase family protein [Candidatus Omnitrophota bacterium]MDD5670812.1 patatin-like phospholipase family protein [Candidatus Omnitrophota bacterium]
MDVFRFRRKLEVAKEYSLDDIPVFSSLSEAEHKLIEKKARIVEYKRGDIVYQEGTQSEAFYVVISGRFRVFTEKSASQGETLFFLYRGDHFGEISLLTGQQHSVSVEAKSDGIVLKLDKEDFLRLVKDVPAISLHLSRSLGHRLTKSRELGGRSREVKIAAFYSQTNSDDSIVFWFDIASRLVRESSRGIIIVDFVSAVPQVIRDMIHASDITSFDLRHMEITKEADVRKCLVEHPNGFYYFHVSEDQLAVEAEKKVSSILTFLTYRFDYLLLRLSKEINQLAFQALKQSDMVYVYCPPDLTDLAACSLKITEFQQSYGFSKSEIKVIVPLVKGSKRLSHEDMERVLGIRIFSVLPSPQERLDRYQATVRYLSRELAGMLVGLVLGSGAAYGLAHIGVLRVFEKENIPIDVIAGSSIGALIGAYWAAGYTTEELEEAAQSITRGNMFFKLIGFRDLSLVHQGFLKGNQLVKFMESYFGDLTFQDLRIPLKIIAADMFTSEEVIFEAGRVVDALRASVSIPGIFRPVQYKGNYLIDGGVLDPLPIKALAQMGVKKIIAVNVLANAEERIAQSRLKDKTKYEQLRSIAEKNSLSKNIASMMYRLRKHYSVSTFNVIMNTILFMECELAQAQESEADVLIHPEIYEGHWAEFYSGAKFIRAGEEKAMEHLGEIRQLLAE